MGVIKNKKWFFIFLLPGLLFYILSVFYRKRSIGGTLVDLPIFLDN